MNTPLLSLALFGAGCLFLSGCGRSGGNASNQVPQEDAGTSAPGAEDAKPVLRTAQETPRQEDSMTLSPTAGVGPGMAHLVLSAGPASGREGRSKPRPLTPVPAPDEEKDTRGEAKGHEAPTPKVSEAPPKKRSAPKAAKPPLAEPAPPAVPETPPAPKKPEISTGELLKSVAIMMTGSREGGTGFVAKAGTSTYFFTNAHVINGGRGMKISFSDGTKLILPNEMEISDEVTADDLVRFRLPDDHPATLRLPDPGDEAAQVGLPVLVMGNSAATGVVPVLKGSIQAVGSYWLEDNSEAIKGNSGGPVILEGTRMVVGMTTQYAAPPPEEEDRGVKGTQFDKVRRLSIRPDRVQNLRRTTVTAFLAEEDALEQIAADSQIIATLLGMKFTRTGVSGPAPESLGLNGRSRLGREFGGHISSINSQARRAPRLSEAAIKILYQRFFKVVRESAGSGVENVEPEAFSLFNRKRFTELAARRKEIRGNLQGYLADVIAQPLP